MGQFPLHVQKWQICKPIANKAGGKTAAILDEHGGPISFTTGILRAPFDASGYNDPDATRVGLCLESDAQLSEWVQELDAELLKLWRINSQKLFGKQVYLESELKPNYFSALKSNEKYGTTLFKMKMNKVGKGGGASLEQSGTG